jgi:dihydropteroate synthase
MDFVLKNAKTDSKRELSLFRKNGLPLIMGIVNVTPDSFYDGGKYLDKEKAVALGIQLAIDGADMLDVGGQSTRPGSESVGPEEQIDRICPVIEKLRAETDIIISVDTTSSKVAGEAISIGAGIVNDISALRFDPEMIGTVVKNKVGLILMHMKGTPKDMQSHPHYSDIVKEISEFLSERVDVAQQAGVKPSMIAIDPGIGFGKTVEGNLQLLKEIGAFKKLNRPVLIGASRKSFIGNLTGADANGRLPGSLAVACFSALNGVDILRVHDVKETLAALKMIKALNRC